MEQPFWCVWSPQGRSPTYRHDSELSALMEAKRLAKLNPEQSFYVLEAVSHVIVDPVTVTRITHRHQDDFQVPF